MPASRLLALTLLFFGLKPLAGEVINFDSYAIGRLPPDWREVNSYEGWPANWSVLADPAAPSRPHVLTKIATQPDARGIPKVIWQKRVFQDGEVSVRLKPMGGLSAEIAGLIFRYADEKNYYMLSANALTGRLLLYRVQNGERMPIGAPAANVQGRDGVLSLPAGEWSRFRVTCDGPNIAVYFNGEKLLEARDATPGWPGTAGLWSDASSLTGFDDFEVLIKK